MANSRTFAAKYDNNKSCKDSDLCELGSQNRDAAHDSVRLDASKIKGCKSLRLFYQLAMVHPNVYRQEVNPSDLTECVGCDV